MRPFSIYTSRYKYMSFEKCYKSMSSYCIPKGSHEIDLLSFMPSKQQGIDNVNQLNTQAQPQKVQFGATIELIKPVESKNTSSQNERLTIYANSTLQRVDIAGLSKERFFQMTEQLLLIMNNFLRMAAVWSIHQINVEIRLVKVKPISASSYLALPTELSRSRFLLNIRKQPDKKCLVCCFTAQYHNLPGSALTTSNESWRQRSIPILYGTSNPSAKQPKGEFTMPMGLNEMNHFKGLDNVRVNVFG